MLHLLVGDQRHDPEIEALQRHDDAPRGGVAGAAVRARPAGEDVHLRLLASEAARAAVSLHERSRRGAVRSSRPRAGSGTASARAVVELQREPVPADGSRAERAGAPLVVEPGFPRDLRPGPAPSADACRARRAACSRRSTTRCPARRSSATRPGRRERPAASRVQLRIESQPAGGIACRQPPGCLAGRARTSQPSVGSLASTRQSSSQTANGPPVAPASEAAPREKRSTARCRPAATSVIAK